MKARTNTPLHSAVRRKKATRIYDTVPILISKATRVDPRNDFGRTPLFIAVRMGNREDALALLEAGADPNVPDEHGHTPAHVAAIKSGAGEVFRTMLADLRAHGADFEIRDSRGRTVEACLVQFGG